MVQIVLVNRARSFVMAALLLGAAAVVSFGVSANESADEERRAAASPPTEATPYIVAVRACIEAEAYPVYAPLTTEERLDACDDLVRISTNAVEAIGIRARNLYYHGSTDEHFAQAHRDLSFVIEIGTKTPHHYANRAFLLAHYQHRYDAALDDINTAIDLPLARERPRAFYFERRAYILLLLAYRDSDEGAVYGALDDIRRALSLNPNARLAPQLEDVAVEILRRLHNQHGRPIQRG